MRQIERDLSNRIGERLAQWTVDSQDLFKMADLKRGRAREAIISHLMYATAFCIAQWLTPETDDDVCKTFKQLLIEGRKRLKKELQ
jgi:hypothetical protein